MTSILDTRSPLLWRACLAGEVSIMEKVMGQGVDPLKMDRNGETCLHMCARSGEVDAVDRMIREGLNFDTPNHNGQTPLHVAVSKGHTGVVRFIVRRGGNTDLKSKFSGMTALHLSCLENESDMAAFLLENGANCAIRDAIGKYADDYTEDDAIQEAFHSHFPVCTHGRRGEESSTGIKTHGTRIRGKDRGNEMTHQSNTVIIDDGLVRDERGAVAKPTKQGGDDNNNDVDDDDDDEDDDGDEEPTRIMSRKERKRSSKKRDKAKLGHLNRGEGKEIYDKMESYDVDRAKGNWVKAKQGGKKIKVNHGLGFSDEHKQRMAQNVFDRLMGGKKK